MPDGRKGRNGGGDQNGGGNGSAAEGFDQLRHSVGWCLKAVGGEKGVGGWCQKAVGGEKGVGGWCQKGAAAALSLKDSTGWETASGGA